MKELRTYQRRSTSRESGYHACDTTTGGECIIRIAEEYECNKAEEIFVFSRKKLDLTEIFEKGIAIIAFGGYIHAKEKCTLSISIKYSYDGRELDGNVSTFIVNEGDWVNIGHHSEIIMNKSSFISDIYVTLSVKTPINNVLNFIAFDFDCITKEEFITTECAVSFYQKTWMHVPYLYYLSTELSIMTYLRTPQVFREGKCVVLKSCNRCGRYLPINIDNEMKTLSFSLHCKKRAPCVHSTFCSYKIDSNSKSLIPELAYQLAYNILHFKSLIEVEWNKLSYFYSIFKTHKQIHDRFKIMLKQDFTNLYATIFKRLIFKRITDTAYTTVRPSSKTLISISETQEYLLSYHGHQLECKACKKFFVNAPLNPQRNAQQFKEDGLRRRAIEVLVNNLLQKNLIHFEFENKTKKEFSRYIWEKFNKRCFKCGPESEPIDLKEMALDHTLPLAYLYRLDETATCLCSSHNSQKSDHFPVDYYNEEELIRLSKITGLSMEQLHTREVNNVVLQLLVKNITWFYDEFLMNPEYQKIRDGIKTADKINDSLRRIIAGKVDLLSEYYKVNKKYPSSVSVKTSKE